MRTIVTVAVGEPFESYMPTFVESLKRFGESWQNMFTFYAWPPDSPPHKDHHYAFKYFAMREVLSRGCRQLLWLDSQVTAIASLEPLWNTLDRDGYVFCNDGAPLHRWISDKALAHFGKTRDQVRDMPVLAGTVIGLDLNKPQAKSFFDEWGELAQVKGGLFMSSHSKAIPGRMRSLPVAYGDEQPISTNPEVLGHRSDEACFTLMAHARGMKVNYQLGRELLTDIVPDTTEPRFVKYMTFTVDANRRTSDGHLDVVHVQNNEKLLNWPGQTARQISCSFTPSDEALAHLGKWYDVVHSGENDVLLHSRGRKR